MKVDIPPKRTPLFCSTVWISRNRCASGRCPNCRVDRKCECCCHSGVVERSKSRERSNQFVPRIPPCRRIDLLRGPRFAPRSPTVQPRRFSRSIQDRSEEHSLNSSHGYISYAVFCLKKKKKTK